MIVLDTSVLSLAFRRSPLTSRVAKKLRWLIEVDEPLGVPGIVLQELLAGIREPKRFLEMREVMAGFPLLLATEGEHVGAARIANDCRRAGVATTAPDCLIAAQAVSRDARLLTTDRDFSHIAEHTGLRLLEIDETD